MGALETIIISGLWALVYIAIILLVAYGIVWVAKSVFGVTIDGNVYHWGRILVMLLCLIVIVLWLFGVLHVIPPIRGF